MSQVRIQYFVISRHISQFKEDGFITRIYNVLSLILYFWLLYNFFEETDAIFCIVFILVIPSIGVSTLVTVILCGTNDIPFEQREENRKEMVNYEGREYNGIKMNDFNFVIVQIVKDGKKRNEKNFCFDTEEKRGNEFGLIYC